MFKKHKKGLRSIVITQVDKEIDELMSLSLASSLKTDVIYTGKDQFNKNVLEKLKALGVKQIVLVGGENSISKEQQEFLKKNGFTVVRIGGKNRYETSLQILNKIKNKKVDVYLVNKNAEKQLKPGVNIKKGSITILVDDKKIDNNLLKKLRGFKGKVYIVGENKNLSKKLSSVSKKKAVVFNPKAKIK